jgi:ATP-dependent exoDNAse (exonuclease V) alpha subunit
MRWSPQQVDALEVVDDWLHGDDSEPWFYLAGYAGTGKSTLAKEIARRAGGNVVYGAFTGKAAAVMRQKGCGDADTIDHLIYRPHLQVACAHEDPCEKPASCGSRCRWRRERFAGRELRTDSPIRQAALVIIDECSMVDEEMARDLLSFGVPVLVLGDPAQLPPIYGAGYFVSGEPDFMLTEIHRQAFGSPIIDLATRVRRGKACQHGQYGDSAVIGIEDISVAEMLQFDQIIVGTHRRRHRINRQCRRHLGFRGELPEVGEKLLCLKNDRSKSLRNGTTWTVVEVGAESRGFVKLLVESDDDGGEVWVHAPIDAFSLRESNGSDLPGQPFAFGYSITGHKAQGSQWGSVLVFDESPVFGRDRWRWLYTAITRAADRITIVS